MRPCHALAGLLCVASCAEPVEPEAEVGVETTDIVGVNEAGDHFGKQMVAGDFNGDGYMDLAVGAPWEHDGATQTGAVYLFKGTSTGLQRWTTITPPASDGVGHFGLALAAGDFDDDGADELVVGAPNASVGSVTDAGKVYAYGGRAAFPSIVHPIQQTPPQSGAEFGSALAVGLFEASTVNGDAHLHHHELVVGIPSQSYIQIFQFVALQAHDDFAHGGLYSAGALTFGTVYGHFGTALAAGNRLGGPYDSLAVGTPGIHQVYMLDGNANGLPASGITYIPDPDPDGVTGYGTVLAFGHFDLAHHDQLVAGAPNSHDNEGRAYVFDDARVVNSIALEQTLLPSDFSFDATGGQFGSAIQAGRFDGSQVMRLAIGAPYAAGDAGRVGVYTPSDYTHFTATGNWGDKNGNIAGAHFGISLAAGTFEGNDFGPADLAVGQPNRSSGAGASWVIHGSSNGLTWNPATETTFLQESGVQ